MAYLCRQRHRQSRDPKCFSKGTGGAKSKGQGCCRTELGEAHGIISRLPFGGCQNLPGICSKEYTVVAIELTEKSLLKWRVNLNSGLTTAQRNGQEE